MSNLKLKLNKIAGAGVEDKKIIITIDTSNEAFEDEGAEVSRILSKLANDYKNDVFPQSINDANGNKVGQVEVQ